MVLATRLSPYQPAGIKACLYLFFIGKLISRAHRWKAPSWETELDCLQDLSAGLVQSACLALQVLRVDLDLQAVSAHLAKLADSAVMAESAATNSRVAEMVESAMLARWYGRSAWRLGLTLTLAPPIPCTGLSADRHGKQ